MIELSVNGLPCVAVTPELAAKLMELGEEPGAFNWLSWPAGASNYGEAVVLMHSDDATKLAKGDRTIPVELVMADDTQSPKSVGMIAPNRMYQIEHRPLHTLVTGTASTSLVAVRMVDARYFWRGNLVNTGFNMTYTPDRSQYYSASEAAGPTPYTFGGIIAALLATLSIAGGTTVNFAASGSAGTPNDQLVNGERACDALDRILSACGLVLYAAVADELNGQDFIIDTPTAYNSNVAKTNDKFVADRIAGDTIYTAGDADGKAWLNAIMPSAITVLFPREIPASAADTPTSTTPPVLNQFYTYSTSAGIPSGTMGRADMVEVIHDTLWARGPIGSETNTAALAARGDFLATAFYSRFKVNHTQCRLKGWAMISPVPGEVKWRLTPSGPMTELTTNGNWDIYGGNVDVVDGFNRKRVVGLGGVQSFKSFDGSLYVSNTGASKDVSFLITSNATPGPIYNRYNAKSITNGTLAAAEDIIVENGAEPISLFASNQLLTATNLATFGVEACGQINSVDSGSGKNVVISWIGFAACTESGPTPIDGSV